MLHAIIMAGGSGTRFWPESRANNPKQLLNLFGDRTMIQATVDRLGDLVPAERILIATNVNLIDTIATQLPQLSVGNFIGEPCKRDTAPCIGLAALHVSRDDPQATMIVMPSDHVIQPTEMFLEAIDFATKLVEARPDRIVTFGIAPTYPAEVFGYIERGEQMVSPDSSFTEKALPVYEVRRFREKPEVDIAQQFFTSGSFYWNSGIFVWKAATIVAALAEHQPRMLRRLQTIADSWGTGEYETVVQREFAAIVGISIDYAVMEHARDVVVIEAPFKWDDVGSWRALARLTEADSSGNTILAKHIGVETTGTIVRGNVDHLIATLGLKDCIVVHTPDATLVADKHNEEAVRQLVTAIDDNGWSQYL